MEFNLSNNENQCAFLTIWIENDDKSWTIYCENHPITKYSNIVVDIDPSRTYLLDIESNIPSNMNKKFKEILIDNKSSRKIWVKVGPDDGQETEEYPLSKSFFICYFSFA